MINPTHDTLFIALRAFLLSFISGVEVVQGLGNGVPMPEGPFIAITAANQRSLATNETTYDGVDERTIKRSTEYSIQVDCYGPLSSDQATEIAMLWNDAYGVEFLLPYGCQPLFNSEPTQSALVNGEENYEQRWMLTAVLQFNPVTTVAQEFADVLAVDIVSVDATYPPL